MSLSKGLGLPRWHSGKESACQCRRYRKHEWFNPWVGKIPWQIASILRYCQRSLHSHNERSFYHSQYLGNPKGLGSCGWRSNMYEKYIYLNDQIYISYKSQYHSGTLWFIMLMRGRKIHFLYCVWTAQRRFNSQVCFNFLIKKNMILMRRGT